MSLDRATPRRRRVLWIAAGAVVLFAVTGFFILPPIIKAQLEKRASAALGRPVTVGKVRLNPFAGSLTLENLDVRLKEGNGSFLGWNRLYVNFDPLASVLGTWTFGAIELDGFHATALLQRDGSFNFDDILQRFKSPAPAGPAPGPLLPALRVGSLKVTGARLDFTDESRAHPFATTFGPVGLAITEFRTVGSAGAPYHFEAVTEAGEKFNWSGTLAAAPFRSEGSLVVENINLPKYLAYYGDRVKGELQAGQFSFHGHYTVDLTEGARVLKLAGGGLQLRGLKIADAPGGEPAVDLPALDVAGLDADAMAMKATVESVAVTGGRLRVQREKDGTLNLLTMFDPSTPEATAAQASPASAPPAKLPDFVVHETAVKDFSVTIADRAASRPAQLVLNAVGFSLKHATLADGAVMPLVLSLGWAPQGTVQVEGSVTIRPELKAELKTNVTGLALLPLSPYVEQFVNARITQGVVSTAGMAQVTLAGGTPAITYAGDVTVEKLGLVDGVHNEELAGFASLTLKDLKAATAPKLTVSLAEINIAAPYARVVINPDKSLNLAALAKTETANVGGALRPDGLGLAEESGRKAPPTPEPTSPAAPLPDIKVGQIVIADGDFSLTDRSVEPSVRMALNKFAGTIAGLSSENLTRADINLAAMVDGIAPFTIVGKLDPFGATRFIDLQIEATNVELLPLSPLIAKYAGYELTRGKLNSSLKFKLDGKQMDAKDIITLNGFTFGAPVASPDATKLPVRLGVALLKDETGQIVIDVPVSGNIDDPEVRLRKAIIRVVVNLLTKVAVSPFSLLGSILGGGGEELAFQEFAPGRSELQDTERKKLETVVKMLESRPALGVAIEGDYDGPADSFALQRIKLADQVRRRIWEERHAVDPNILPPEQLVITPEEDVAMVQKLFDAKFPPGTEFGAPLVEKPVVIATPPPPKPGFFKRVVDTITFKEQRKDKPSDQSAVAMRERYDAALEVAAAQGVPLAEMAGRLAQAIEVTDEDLRALAAARSARVRDYFLTEGKITADRIFLTQGSEQAKENKGPRVFLSPQ